MKNYELTKEEGGRPCEVLLSFTVSEASRNFSHSFLAYWITLHRRFLNPAMYIVIVLFHHDLHHYLLDNNMQVWHHYQQQYT